MKYSVCCHTRDFEHINDFIEHHLNLGFDRIVIYDNKSVVPVKYDDERVIVHLYEGLIGPPYDTYNDYVKRYCNEAGWTAFIDEDEFINTKGRTIQEAMKEFQHYDSLALNWRIFGDKIDVGNEETNIVKKYIYHVPEEWTGGNGGANHKSYIKSIVKNDAVVKFVDPHYPVLKPKKYNRGVRGQIVHGSVTEIKDVTSSIWIDHYHFRGLENYIARQTRPIAGRKTRSVKEVKDMYDTNIVIATKKREVW